MCQDLYTKLLKDRNFFESVGNVNLVAWEPAEEHGKLIARHYLGTFSRGQAVPTIFWLTPLKDLHGCVTIEDHCFAQPTSSRKHKWNVFSSRNLVTDFPLRMVTASYKMPLIVYKKLAISGMDEDGCGGKTV